MQLSSTSYIEAELREWRQHKYLDYVHLVETPLMEAFAAPVWRRTAEKYARAILCARGECHTLTFSLWLFCARLSYGVAQATNARCSRTVVNVPVHFYGELVRTSDGCDILKTSGHFHEFVEMIRSDSTSLIQKRGALWALVRAFAWIMCFYRGGSDQATLSRPID